MCFHKFGKWSEAIDRYDSHKLQFRKCKKCDIIKCRTIGSFVGLLSHVININLKDK